MARRATTDTIPTTSADPTPAIDPGVNEVRLEGRLSGAPTELQLPSGDRWAAFRLVVPRPASRPARRVEVKLPTDVDVRPRRIPTSDTIDCVARTAQLRKRILAAEPGSLVEVSGALHRRFYRSPGGLASRYEVSVASVRVTRRSGSRAPLS